MRIASTLIFVALITVSAWAQTPDFVEHYDYAAGALTNATSNWTTHSGTAGQVSVLGTSSDVGNSLSYSGYQSQSGR